MSEESAFQELIDFDDLDQFMLEQRANVGAHFGFTCKTYPDIYLLVSVGDHIYKNEELLVKLELLIASLSTRPDLETIVHSLELAFSEGRSYRSRKSNELRAARIVEHDFVGATRSRAKAGEFLSFRGGNTDRLFAGGIGYWSLGTLWQSGGVDKIQVPEAVADVVRNGVKVIYTDKIKPNLGYGFRQVLTRLSELLLDPAGAMPNNMSSDFSHKSWQSLTAFVGKSIRNRADIGERRCVLVCAHWLAVGGAEKFAFELIKRIDRARFYVILTVDNPADLEWQLGLQHYVDEFIPLYDYIDPGSSAAFLEYLVSSRHVDVMHIHHSDLAYRSLGLIRKRCADVKIFDTLHIIERHPTAGYPGLSGSTFSPLLDFHHVASNCVGNYLVEKHGVSRARVRLGYTIEQPVETVFDVSNSRLCKLAGVPEDAFIVGFVGRFVEQKRPQIFIEMCKELVSTKQCSHAEDGRSVFYVMIGDGELHDECKKLVSRYALAAHCKLTGRLDQIDDVIPRVDVLVQPSQNEGLALVTLSAVTNGVPVVMTDVGAQSELLGIESLVTESEGVSNAFAEKVGCIISDAEFSQKVSQSASENLRSLRGKPNGYAVCLQAYEA